MALEFAPVTQSNWADFERLFEATGGPKYCWCIAFRPKTVGENASPAARKAAINARVREGTPIGLLAYREGEPVGWCSVGPKRTFARLGGSGADDGLWSITCFFVPRNERGKGVAAALLDAATDHAFAHGASAVEAYPVDPDSPSYRFMGQVPMFARHGFVETGRAGKRRHVMQLDGSRR